MNDPQIFRRWANDLAPAVPMVFALATLSTIVLLLWLQSIARVHGLDLLNGWAFSHGTILLVAPMFILLFAVSLPKLGSFALAFVLSAMAASWATVADPLATAALLVMAAGYAAFAIIRVLYSWPRPRTGRST